MGIVNYFYFSKVVSRHVFTFFGNFRNFNLKLKQLNIKVQIKQAHSLGHSASLKQPSEHLAEYASGFLL